MSSIKKINDRMEISPKPERLGNIVRAKYKDEAVPLSQLVAYGATKPVLKYVALVTQSGGNAPTQNILENNTGGTITWSRTAAGEYLATASGFKFLQASTIVFVSPNAQATVTPSSVYWQWASETEIYVLTIEEGGNTNLDGILRNTSFEFRVY